MTSTVTASPVVVKERPILFRAEMVRAILDRSKTQTRRIVKPQSLFHDKDAIVLRYPQQHGCPYGEPGDRLWVRETWQMTEPSEMRPLQRRMKPAYRADYKDSLSEMSVRYNGLGRWRSPIHMPRWASRLTLEITDIRVQRVQDISEADAEAEGASVPAGVDPNATTGWRDHLKYRLSFELLWNSIHGDGAWALNPFVWAITFRVVASPAAASSLGLLRTREGVAR